MMKYRNNKLGKLLIKAPYKFTNLVSNTRGTSDDFSVLFA